jgi:protein-disulfide isomerase
MTDLPTQARPKRHLGVLGWVVLALIGLGAVGALFMSTPGLRWVGSTDVAGNMSREEFGRRVRDYLLEHPEVLADAANALEARQGAAQASAAQAVVRERAEEIFRDPDSPVGGNASGDATLVEFFDYNCPYCRQVAPTMAEAVAADPQLRIVYKEFPILGPNSVYAAKAALASRKQDMYLIFHDALMKARSTTDEARVIEIAGSVGLDVEQLKRDMQDPAIESIIKKNFALAQALQINGTPGFVIGERVFTGATDLKSMQTFVQQAREAR